MCRDQGDWLLKNGDGQMPILDTKVWTDKQGTLLYQQYEKGVSSKTVLHAKSAHSAACKRGVHTQEVIRIKTPQHFTQTHLGGKNSTGCHRVHEDDEDSGIWAEV